MGRVANNAFVLVAFGALLLFGLTVDSSVFIEGYSTTSLLAPAYIVAAFVSFTPTNLLCMAVVAAYIGEQTATQVQKPIGETWNRALLYGIIVFATVFFFGNYLDQTIILEATQKDYCTLAGAVLTGGFGISGAQTIIKNRTST